MWLWGGRAAACLVTKCERQDGCLAFRPVAKLLGTVTLAGTSLEKELGWEIRDHSWLTLMWPQAELLLQVWQAEMKTGRDAKVGVEMLMKFGGLVRERV